MTDKDDATAAAELRRAEASVEAHSAVFKKALGLTAIVLTSEIGLQVATNLAYALGPSAAWLAGSKWVIMAASCVVIGALMIVSTIGLGVGKWVHNAGGVVMIAIFIVLVALPILNVA